MDCFRRVIIPLLACFVTLAFATSRFAQAQAPQPKAPAAAVSEKNPATAPPPKKKPEIPKNKQTTLGLYVTAQEAYEIWQKDPKKVKVLDCRTPEEYRFVGHAPMAYNIPMKFMAYRWDPAKKANVMQNNPRFVAEARKKFTKADTVLVMCVFGGRSAKAVNRLAKAGFTKVYNIIDGFEGDKIRDKTNPQFGKRMKNGWKNSGLPWTNELNPKLMYLPQGK